jgi:hypothetical protein
MCCDTVRFYVTGDHRAQLEQWLLRLTAHLLCNSMISRFCEGHCYPATVIPSHPILLLNHCNSFLSLILNSYSFLRPGDKPATNVSLVASCPSFIHVAPRNVMIQRIGGMGQQGTPIMVKIYLYATKTHLPTGAASTLRDIELNCFELMICFVMMYGAADE